MTELKPAESRPDRCPLCGEANGCPMAGGATCPGVCWCRVVDMPSALVQRVPAEARGVACICHACVARESRRQPKASLARPGESYFTDDGRFVFTARYHLRRGYCCGNGCRHCPYDAEGRPRREVVEALT